jgi:hypothetical protein
MALHDRKEFDNNFGRGTDDDLAFAAARGIADAFEAVVLAQCQAMVGSSQTADAPRRRRGPLRCFWRDWKKKDEQAVHGPRSECRAADSARQPGAGYDTPDGDDEGDDLP